MWESGIHVNVDFEKLRKIMVFNGLNCLKADEKYAYILLNATYLKHVLMIMLAPWIIIFPSRKNEPTSCCFFKEQCI